MQTDVSVLLRIYHHAHEQEDVSPLISDHHQERMIGDESESLYGPEWPANRGRGGRFGTLFVNLDDGLMFDLGDVEVFMIAHSAEIGLASYKCHSHPFHKMMTFTPSLHRGGFCLFARRSFAL
jgi:hypothetical protein